MRTIGIMSVAATAALLTAGQAYAATVLVVAGGGGGAGFNADGTNARSGTAGSAGSGVSAGAGGTSGSGGASSTLNGGGGGGGGLNSAGASGLGSPPGMGGSTGPSFSGGTGGLLSGSGGFGGGGGGGNRGSENYNGGGGGGYSGGGGGGRDGGGGGGGSYLDASLTTIGPSLLLNPGNTSGNGANGYVTISFLGNNPFSTVFNFTGTIQNYTFSSTGQYSIVAAGAQGGSSPSLGGLGALIGASGFFTANSTLDLIVGGGGISSRFGAGGGGGGGSFVFQTFAAPDVSAVPEPASWAMMIVGFGAIGAAMRRRKVTTRVSYAA